jgi:outer membrane lipoprotein-sorting protein
VELSRLLARAAILAASFACYSYAQGAPDAADIISRAAANYQSDSKAAAQFTSTLREAVTKLGDRAEKTYSVRILDGSPYAELIAIDGKALGPKQKAREEKRLARETKRRERQSASARAKRIAAFTDGRRPDQLVARDLLTGYEYKLAGTEQASGRECFKLEGSPAAHFRPKSHEGRILRKSRATLWIDTKLFRLIRAEAALVKPAALAPLIAKVQPGTEIALDQTPVEDNVWLARYFEIRVESTVGFLTPQSLKQDTYSDFKKVTAAH